MLPKLDGLSLIEQVRNKKINTPVIILSAKRSVNDRIKGLQTGSDDYMEHVWDYSFDPQTNVVDVLVCRLRNKVDKEFETKLIHTIRGVGYVLKIS
jgi:DNA-binding response OmpR family regulator